MIAVVIHMSLESTIRAELAFVPRPERVSSLGRFRWR